MRRQLLTLDVHADRMCLHDGSLSVHVDDKPRQAVALSVDKAVNIIVTASYKAQRLTQTERLCQPLRPKRGIDCHIVERKYTHSYRTNLVVSDGKKSARLVKHAHGVALDYVRICPGNGARKYPRMEALQAVGFSAPKGDCLIGHMVCFHLEQGCNRRSL